MPFVGKEENKKRLIQAVGTILARDGFKNLKINKVAKEAGVDKVLIYRYFGGLSELVVAFSRTATFWPGVDELLGPDKGAVRNLSAERQFAFFFKSFLRALRRRPMTQMIIVWWASDPKNDIAKQFDEVCMHTAMAFFEQLEKIPVDRDLTAAVVLLHASIVHLIEVSQTAGFFGGIDLGTEAGWHRIEEGIDLLTKGIFSG